MIDARAHSPAAARPAPSNEVDGDDRRSPEPKSFLNAHETVRRAFTIYYGERNEFRMDRALHDEK